MAYQYKISTNNGVSDLSVAEEELSRIAEGGTASVSVHHLDDNLNYALKIYRNPASIDWEKIEYMISIGGNGVKLIYSGEHINLAWPLAIIKKENLNVGVALSYLAPSTYLTLDHWVEYHLLKKV